MAVISLEFLSWLYNYFQRGVFTCHRIYVSCHTIYMLLHFTHILVTDREFFGSRCQNRDTKVAAWVEVGSARVVARSSVRAGGREDERQTSERFVS